MAGTLVNLMFIFDKATTAELVRGADWYNQAHLHARKIQRLYSSVSLDMAAGVIAALSPRSKWARNMDDAYSLTREWAQDGSLENVSCGTFHRNKNRAWEILEAGTRHGVLSGNKVIAFADTIEDPGTTSVVVDTHAYNAWVGRRVIVGGRGPKITDKRYADASDDYREVARVVDINPAQAQAIIWLTWIRLLKEDGQKV